MGFYICMNFAQIAIAMSSTYSSTTATIIAHINGGKTLSVEPFAHI